MPDPSLLDQFSTQQDFVISKFYLRHPGPRAGIHYNIIMTDYKGGFVYILASHKNGTLYIGVTSYLIKSVYQYMNHIVPGFTDKYDINKLVYFEKYDEIADAISREKQLKNWCRSWKIDLIEKTNPNWEDLYDQMDPGSSPG
jgi:putative endonuclease